jgi:hypothetical protein
LTPLASNEKRPTIVDLAGLVEAAIEEAATAGLQRRLDARTKGGVVDDVIAKLTAAGGSQESYEISEDSLLQVLTQAGKIMCDQPVLLDLCTPLKVVGDIKGQLPDLQQLLEMHGDPAHTGYLFMGNYLAADGSSEDGKLCL